jgi:phosphoribosylglycinamide formyltransferase-1
VKVAGCTVHFVDPGMDTGPIIAQAVVPVLPGDDEAALTARILKEEHRLYPLVVKLVTTGAVRLEGGRVVSEAGPAVGELSLRNPGEPG